MRCDQIAVDMRMIELDGTPNKKKLGANAILGVSLATAHAAAKYGGLPLYRYLGGSNARLLPAPMMNIINGGAHADNAVDVQEFMVMPLGFDTFSDALRCGCEVFHHLKKVLHDKKLNTAVGDEGGLRARSAEQRRGARSDPDGDREGRLQAGRAGVDRAGRGGDRVLRREEEGLQDRRQGDRFGRRWSIFGAAGSRSIRSARSKTAAAKDDWEGWKLLTEAARQQDAARRRRSVRHQHRAAAARHRRGHRQQHSVKVNQIGTLTETIEAIRLADRNGYTSVMSHRSGETEDSTIADLAVALGTGQIKTGSRQPHRPHGEVQPAAADRRAAGRRGAVWRAAVPEAIDGSAQLFLTG